MPLVIDNGQVEVYRKQIILRLTRHSYRWSADFIKSSRLQDHARHAPDSQNICCPWWQFWQLLLQECDPDWMFLWRAITTFGTVDRLTHFLMGWRSSYNGIDTNSNMCMIDCSCGVIQIMLIYTVDLFHTTSLLFPGAWQIHIGVDQ